MGPGAVTRVSQTEHVSGYPYVGGVGQGQRSLRNPSRISQLGSVTCNYLEGSPKGFMGSFTNSVSDLNISHSIDSLDRKLMCSFNIILFKFEALQRQESLRPS